MGKKKLDLNPSSICFGTDGWRGVLGVDFTLENLLIVAAAAAQELAFRSPEGLFSRKVIIGFDRRFLAEEMAEAIASAVRGCELEPLIAETPLPTPSCSWAVVQHRALGALIITASHNPAEWLGLKIKSHIGGSVEKDFTNAVEKRLLMAGKTIPIEGITKRIDFRKEHLNGLRKKFDLNQIANGLRNKGLKVIVDPMHGSASGCMGDLFGDKSIGIIEEIRSNHDTLFGGNPPEPLSKYLSELIEKVRQSSLNSNPTLGLAFDGDGDRIAAIDEKGTFCNTQLLMPVFIDHLARVRKLPGCVVKTVSGSDLMRFVSEDLGREVLELPVGFKYIASTMLSREVLVGGEESGGIGFGAHIPERDALYAALLLLEALAEDNHSLNERINSLKGRFGNSYFDRIDVVLEDLEMRKKCESFLTKNLPSVIGNKLVKEVILIDGVKLRLDNSHWVMFRFSGTEPLLRIYCEAPSKDEALSTLRLARELVDVK